MPDIGENSASSIGPRVRELRERRRWSQVELARELGLSQPRLSQIERGQGSFSAEQFLRILTLFNVGVEHFVAAAPKASPIQNALARHGATHLVEGDALVPSTLAEPIEVVWDVLRSPESPRHVTALAPVLVVNVDRISLPELAARLARLGREARLGWLLESFRIALAGVEGFRTAAERRDLRRADLAAELALQSGILRPPPSTAPLDLLDLDVRSLKTAERIGTEASPEAKRWRIATRLHSIDFLEAMEAAREAR
jgi:transcriptional regulator with XRE-family HTH domain